MPLLQQNKTLALIGAILTATSILNYIFFDTIQRDNYFAVLQGQQYNNYPNALTYLVLANILMPIGLSLIMFSFRLRTKIQFDATPTGNRTGTWLRNYAGIISIIFLALSISIASLLALIMNPPYYHYPGTISYGQIAIAAEYLKYTMYSQLQNLLVRPLISILIFNFSIAASLLFYALAEWEKNAKIQIEYNQKMPKEA